MPHLPEDSTMLYMTIDEKNQSYIVQCADFQPKKQRFSWKKLGKDGALVLAKQARDLQVEKRRYNKQRAMEQQLKEEQEEEKERIARNKMLDELEEKRAAEEEELRIQRNMEERSAVYKIKLPEDLDIDRRRLVTRDLFFKEYKYYYMKLSELESELPSLIKQYDMISPWDRVWLGLKQ
jgi:hypothetical protein